MTSESSGDVRIWNNWALVRRFGAVNNLGCEASLFLAVR